MASHIRWRKDRAQLSNFCLSNSPWWQLMAILTLFAENYKENMKKTVQRWSGQWKVMWPYRTVCWPLDCCCRRMTNQQVTYRHPNHIKTTLQSCQLFKSSVTRHAITQRAQSFLVQAQVMKCFSKWQTSKIRLCSLWSNRKKLRKCQ